MMLRACLKLFVLYAWCYVLSLAAPLISDVESACLSAPCNESAQIMLDSLDQTEDPCKDFYQFACGGYLAKNPLPADKSSYGTFQKLGDEAMEQLRQILEQLDPRDIPEVVNGKLMYQHCLKKEDNIEDLKKHVLNLGGWPILSDSKTSAGDIPLESILAKTGLRGLNTIFAADINVDMRIATTNVLQVDQGQLPLGRDNILEPETYKDLIEGYKKFIEVSTTLLGTSRSIESIKVDVDKMIAFETNLANLTSPPSERRNFTRMYTKMTIGDLQNTTDPQTKVFNWLKYFNNYAIWEFNGTEPIVVSEAKYLSNALALIAVTEYSTVVNYIIWSFIKQYSWHTGGKLLEANFEFQKVQRGVKAEPPRWLSCTEYVDDAWGFAVGKPYVEKHFPSESKQNAETMTATIHQALSDRLQNVTFLDEPTRKVAKEKSAAMLLLIGYPDWIMNDTAQQLYYIDYPNMNSSHLNNMLGSTTGKVIQQAKLLRKPVDKKRFYMSPATVNAMYNPLGNSITFPAAVLQSPLYKFGRPTSMNYGAIGSVVGHEITHGFDDQGSQFDKDGNLKEWWPNNVRAAFVEETKCFIEQYGTYCPPELSNTTKQCLNGVTTQGENIADNGGLEQSFTAYKTWLSSNGPDKKLLGLEKFTSEQLFFLSFAHVWCGSATPQHLSNQILYDPHSIARYRVIGPLSNSKEFAKAFQCNVGPMNRGDKRCKLW